MSFPPGGTFVDLMSGSGVVSAWCAGMYRVISNDVQSYSAVIARSLIGHSPGTRDDFLSALDPEADLLRVYEENYARLAGYYGAALEEEAGFLDAYESGRADEAWAAGYREYLHASAALYPGVAEASVAEPFRSALPLLRDRKAAAGNPACLAATYLSLIHI